MRVSPGVRSFIRHKWVNRTSPLGLGDIMHHLIAGHASHDLATVKLFLTHLSRMYFPIFICRTSLFQILRVLGGIFHFYSNRTFFEKTVETLIRRRIQRRLIWVCAVCHCPTKRTLDLYMGLCKNMDTDQTA